MTTSFKLFLLLFLFIFTRVFSESKIDLDKYRLYVTDVDPEFHCFTLSNQMVCYEAQNNWESHPLPEVGAEIRLAPKKTNPAMTIMEEGEFLAFFSSGVLKKLTPVWMTEQSKQSFLTYVTTEKIYLEPDRWCSETVKVIELSDGSKWTTESKAKLKLVKGDHVLVNRIDDQRCWLIDVDRSTTLGSSRNTKFVRDNGIVVTPYLP